jgi:hypothetical protein
LYERLSLVCLTLKFLANGNLISGLYLKRHLLLSFGQKDPQSVGEDTYS